MSTDTGMPRDIDQLLALWFDESPSLAAGRVIEGALAEVGQTRQVRRSWLVWPSPETDPNRRASRLLAIVALVIALMVATLGIGVAAGLFRNVLPQPSAPAQSADPESIHVTQTSLGQLEWTRVESSRRIIPWSEIDGQLIGVDSEMSEWFISRDGGSWSSMPSAPWGYEADYLDTADGPLAFVSPDYYSVMMPFASPRKEIYEWHDEPGDAAIFEREGATWAPVAVPTGPAPRVDGLAVSSIRYEAATAGAGSDWIVASIRFVRVPWGEVLGIDGGDPAPTWNAEKNKLEFLAPGTPTGLGTTLDVTQVDGTPPMIEFRDSIADELVHSVPATLPGWSAEALLNALRGWGLDDVHFLARVDGEVREVLPPWPSGEAWGEQIVTAGGRYFTASFPLGEDYSATDFHLWESDDGIAWRAVDANLSTEPFETAYLAGSGDRLVVNIQGLGAETQIWSSTMGRDWVRASLDAEMVGIPTSSEFGFLMQRDYSTVLISRDGATWEQAELPGLPGEPSLNYLNGLMLFGPEEVNGVLYTWIGRLK